MTKQSLDTNNPYLCDREQSLNTNNPFLYNKAEFRYT